MDVINERVELPPERCVPIRVRTTLGLETAIRPGLDRFVLRGYAWTLDRWPGGSRSELIAGDRPEATITPDRPGDYEITVRVQSERTGTLTCPITVIADLADPRCPGYALVEPQVQAFAAGRMQLGLDVSWIAVNLRVVGQDSVIQTDDERAVISAAAFERPLRGTLEEHAASFESIWLRQFAAVPVLMGRAGTTRDGTPYRRTTLRVQTRSLQGPEVLRDGYVAAVLATPSPPSAVRHDQDTVFYVELTTLAPAGTGHAYTLVTVASARASDDSARPTAIRVEDFANGSSLSPLGQRAEIACHLVTATRVARADFLWFVDTSGSMNNDQQLVGQTAQDFFRDLALAGLDFRVGVFQAGSTRLVLEGPPPFRWISGDDPMGARRMAFQVTTQTFGGDTTDRERPFPISGGSEEPVAASVITTEELERRASAGETNPEFLFRPDAARIVFWVTDEAGTNDDTRYFARTPMRWGTTPAMRANAVAAFFRTREILPFGLIRVTPGVGCDAATNFLSCAITAAGGAFIPLNENDAIQRDAAFRAAMRRVVDRTAGAGSEFSLPRDPISSTIRVRVNTTLAPRSRADGFDYDEPTNSLVFRGRTYRPRIGEDVRAAYFYWQNPR